MTDGEPTPTESNESNAESDGETTDSTRTRWPYTNDVLAGVLVLMLCGTVGYALVATVDVPRMIWAPFAAAALLAAVWAFGSKNVEALKELTPPWGG